MYESQMKGFVSKPISIQMFQFGECGGLRAIPKRMASTCGMELVGRALVEKLLGNQTTIKILRF